MYEEILGRPASAPEKKMLGRGFIPSFRVGDKVKCVSNHDIAGELDAIVLFAVPPHPINPHPSLVWAFRIKDWINFLPAHELVLAS